MPVTFLESSHAFLIEGKRSAIVLALDSQKRLLECYRGLRLPYPSDYPQSESTVPVPPKLGGQEGRDNLNPFAYPSRYGAFFREPCLDVIYADGTRDLRLCFQKYQIDGNRLTIQLDDPKGINVQLRYHVIEDLDIVEHEAIIKNYSSSALTLRSALTVATYAYGAKNLELVHLSGQWLNEFNRNREPVGHGKNILESRRGNTSAQSNPFWTVVEPATTEESGTVYFGQIACSGNWKFVLERTPQGPTALLAGRNDYDASEALAPGEAIALPKVITGFGSEGLGDMSRRLHAYQNHYVLPGPKRPRPVLYNSWEATYFDVDLKGQMTLADRAAAIGIELFVLDDGWFSSRRDANSGLGDWWVNQDAFPEGLRPLAEHVRSLGMRFGLWFEPEMVNPDSELFRTHPEWIYAFPDREPTQRRNQLVLNCARKDVRDYLMDQINKVVSETGVQFIKWDMNRGITEAGWAEAKKGKEGNLWQAHAAGVYEMMDSLRETHPGLEIESCASGGSRVDIGVLQRADQVLPSDNTDAYDRLFIHDGFSLAYTPRTMMSWVTHVPNWLTERSAPLRFRLHVSMAGGLAIGEALDRMPQIELDTCRDWIHIYKEIRQTIQYGVLYRILPPQKGYPCAVEYLSPDKAEAIIFAYWPQRSWNDDAIDLKIKGLEPTSTYICERLERPNTSFEDPNDQKTMSGLAWENVGLRLNIRGDYASVVYKVSVCR